MKNTITMIGDNYYINATKIPNKVFYLELTEYKIEDRECLIHNLIQLISECRGSRENEKIEMIADLKMIMNLDEEFILSSISTNHYLYGNSDEFNTQCEEILRKV